MGISTGDNYHYILKEKEALGSYKIVEPKKVLSENELLVISEDNELRNKISANGIPKSMFNGKTIIPLDKGSHTTSARAPWPSPDFP